MGHVLRPKKKIDAPSLKNILIPTKDVHSSVGLMNFVLILLHINLYIVDHHISERIVFQFRRRFVFDWNLSRNLHVSDVALRVSPTSSSQLSLHTVNIVIHLLYVLVNDNFGIRLFKFEEYFSFDWNLNKELQIIMIKLREVQFLRFLVLRLFVDNISNRPLHIRRRRVSLLTLSMTFQSSRQFTSILRNSLYFLMCITTLQVGRINVLNWLCHTRITSDCVTLSLLCRGAREIVWVIDVVSATSFRMGLSFTLREVWFFLQEWWYVLHSDKNKSLVHRNCILLLYFSTTRSSVHTSYSPEWIFIILHHPLSYWNTSIR